LNQPCGATTAPSLSDRIAIDGDLSDWAADEWVLDATTTLPEPSDDSRWRPTDELLRVGVTWDERFLYLAFEFRSASSLVLGGVGFAPGGLRSLDGAGAFRRAIDLPFAPNIVLLADGRSEPRIARASDVGVLTLLDRATAPAASRAPAEGPATLEAALPWSIVVVGSQLQLTVALTGEEGTGAGDAAPDPSVALPVSATPASKTRAVLDRWLSMTADADQDGGADPGVSPRNVVTVHASDTATNPRSESLEATLRVATRAFAPDRGESASFVVNVSGAEAVTEVFASARVLSIDGKVVRVLYENAQRSVVGASLAIDARDTWDGRDAGGRVVSGGVYVISFEWGLAAGERAGRATAGVAVAR
jgi:hypothetical protein